MVLIATCIIGYSLGMKDIYPGTFFNLICNIILLKNSYCGAWWFVQTYVILVMLSPVIFKIIDKYNSKIVIFVSSIIYFIAYLQTVKNLIPIRNEYILLIINAIGSLGTNQLAFIIGAISVKEKIYSKINNIFSHIEYINIICLLGILALIIIHGFIESMFISPFIGILFIYLFNLMKLDNISLNLWNYVGVHSTNIWLTHMLFYAYFAKDFVFLSRNVIIIFITVIYLSLISSYIIDFIYSLVIKFIQSRRIITAENL